MTVIFSACAGRMRRVANEVETIWEVISSKETEHWNEIVKSFPHWDIYYLNEYARSLEVHGDGNAFLVYFRHEGETGVTCRLCFVVMCRDIHEDARFADILENDVWYDWETPYGYGGFLIEGEFAGNAVDAFEETLEKYAREHRIVSLFVRFYPVYRNEIPYRKLSGSEIRYLKDTVYIDTEKKDEIMTRMDSKNRNMVRKAQRNGVTVFHDKGEHLDEFIAVYEATMDHNGAEGYYYFERSYYEYLIETMSAHTEFFYSVYEGKIIGASIFFYNEEYMHYHLSGVYTQYRSLAATNLLLYEAALWASGKGIRLLHLGGGIEADDSLFGFKKQFNKNGRLPFYIGRLIFNQEAYQELLCLRKKEDENFDTENGFMIQYRR